MKFGTVLLIFLFSACALGGVVWLGYVQPIKVKKIELLEEQGLKPAPKIDLSGPQPKAVAVDPVFDFGQAIVRGKYSHVFTLKNEGEAPLMLTQGESSCQCTISSLERNKVLPGESVAITLEWEPDKSDEEFHHSADIHTNDPKSQTVTFEIKGEVVESIVTMPPESWTMPTILDDEPTTYSALFLSPAFEDFQIKEIKTSNPLLSAKHVKLDESELTQFKMKAGYRIELELKPGAPVGPFNESLTFVTNIKDIDAYAVNVRSHRFGPMTIQTLQNCRWNPRTMGVDMKDFPASEGRISTLLLNVKNFGDKDLEFRDIEKDVEYLQFTFAPYDSDTEKGPKRYLLTFEIPPGSPRAIRRNQSAAKVRVKTNHPEVPEITFRVHFISR